MLPFDRERYRASLANDGARERFDALLERATCVLELPGDSDARARRLCHDRPRDRRPLRHPDRDLGRASAARPRRHRRSRRSSRSRAARRSSTCRPTRRASRGCCGARSIPTVLTVADDPSVERPLDRDDIDALLTGLLMPPPDQQEQRLPQALLRANGCAASATRIEYPLLLTAAGVRRFRRWRLHREALRAQIRDEWRRYREGCADAHSISAPIDVAGGGVQLGRPARDPFRADLPQRPYLQLSARRPRGVPGPQRVHGAASQVRVRGARDADHFGDHPQRACRQRARSGIAAGSTIASSPSGCGRCAA